MGRNFFCLIIALRVVAYASLAGAQQGAPPPKKVALLVGVNDYDSAAFPDLRFAEQDVTALAEELHEIEFKTVVLKGSAKGELQATRANIRTQLVRLLRESEIGPRDIVVVAFSGHGQQIPVVLAQTDAGAGANGTTAAEGFLSPRDAEVDRPESQFSLRELTDEILAPIGARKLILVDACRGRPPSDDGLVEAAITGRNGVRTTNRKLPPDTLILYSCSSDQFSFEMEERQHGLFFHAVIEALAQYRVRNRDPFDNPTIPAMIFEMASRAATDRPAWAKQDVAGEGEMERDLRDWCSLTTPPDAPEAHRLFREGEAAVKREGDLRDEKLALRLLRRAAQAGHLEAACLVGRMCAGGQATIQNDYEAIRCYRYANSQGEAYGAVLMGWMYEYGRGVRQNHKEAVAWYEKGARKGHPEGEFALAAMYESGRGVARSEKKAAEWYRKAAAQNHAPSQSNLGVLYEFGRGVPQDYKQAAAYYRQAADKDPNAQFNLGLLYANGNGVPKDEAEAIRWFRKAAKQGHYDAQQELYERNAE